MPILTLYSKTAKCYEVSEDLIKHGLIQPHGFNNQFRLSDTVRVLSALAQSAIENFCAKDRIQCNLVFGIKKCDPSEEIAALVLEYQLEDEKLAHPIYESIIKEYNDLFTSAQGTRLVIAPTQHEISYEQGECEFAFDADSTSQIGSSQTDPLFPTPVGKLPNQHPLFVESAQGRHHPVLGKLLLDNQSTLRIESIAIPDQKSTNPSELFVSLEESSDEIEPFECEGCLLGIPNLYPPCIRVQLSSQIRKKGTLDFEIPPPLQECFWSLLPALNRNSPAILKLLIQVSDSKYQLLDFKA